MGTVEAWAVESEPEGQEHWMEEWVVGYSDGYGSDEDKVSNPVACIW